VFVVQEGEDDRWYLPKDAWSLFHEGGKVVGFMSGSSKVPGSFKIEETDTGIRWRYAKANKLLVNKDSITKLNRSQLAFRTVSSLFVNELEGLKFKSKIWGVQI